jgi:hypothetical protein
MNVPLPNGDLVRISAASINHWATVILGIIVGLIGWSYQIQQNQLDRLQLTYQILLQTCSTQDAELKAHQAGDVRQDEMVQSTAKKQVEVLSRLTALETTMHDLSLEIDRLRGIDDQKK